MYQPELSVLTFQRHGERQLVATLGCQIFVRGFIQARSPVTAHPPVFVSVAVILSAGDKHELMVAHHAVYPVGVKNPLQESPGLWATINGVSQQKQTISRFVESSFR